MRRGLGHNKRGGLHVDSSKSGMCKTEDRRNGRGGFPASNAGLHKTQSLSVPGQNWDWEQLVAKLRYEGWPYLGGS